MSRLKAKASLSVLAVLSIAALMPLASAATAIDVEFSTLANPSVEGARMLVPADEEAEMDPIHRGQVELPVVFAMENALASGAAFSNADYNFTIYLATPHGNATVSLGYAQADGTFVPLVARTVDVERESRGVLHDTAPTTGTPVDIGVVHAHLTGVNVAYPAGSFVAIKVEASLENDMFTQASMLGAADKSSATVPLPELTAGMLFVLGLATIGAFAVIRSRKEA